MFNEEAAGYETPTGTYTIGLGMVIPTIVEHGTEEQKERYIRKALRGEEKVGTFGLGGSQRLMMIGT